MAINPNTDFTTGQVLTAAEQNRFPRGVMAVGNRITSFTLSTVSQAIPDTTVTWTADPLRLYKITAFFFFQVTAGTGSVFGNISNGTGVRIAEGGQYAAPTNYPSVHVTVYESGLSGTQTRRLNALFLGITAASIIAAADYPTTIIVEDIGAA